ncbi:acetyl-CoA carboxylase biotin carboxyl carrier protein subunit [Pseudomonas sp. KU26590]|uniref:acetyl-CoA carboxylase biotin carboxyl carrier protein n=1 Tax=Pseudomonas sp. KU26590 TaxID=2991051 RepID=UPI00223E0062|nr:biotin/lipoyl-containing protein [Pseudomonas sp. KU26590]UZJ57851.1 acetyl-CoA carboxylase biotin carboxyl carrier protein subunit [Pseudomonas sp. KU26590]
MDQQRIKHLIDLLAESDLSALTLSEGGTTVTLSRHGGVPAATLPAETTAAQAIVEPAAAPVKPPPGPNQPGPSQSHSEASQPEPTRRQVCSPLYGVLHLTPSPDEPPFVAIGDAVTAGQTLCIVEAMKMFHQVTAPRAGQVNAILAAGGAEVESGQPLFDLI